MNDRDAPAAPAGVWSPDGVSEAERLHRAIFRSPPSATVARRFEAAVELLKLAATASQVAGYHRVLAEIGDLEALEVAARHRSRLPLLQRAVRLMVYIAEAEPANQHFFVKRRAGFASAVAVVIGGGVRTSYKLVKGLVLLARVEHV